MRNGEVVVVVVGPERRTSKESGRGATTPCSGKDGKGRGGVCS